VTERRRGPGLEQLLVDLAAEHEALDALVAALEPPQWRLPTPAAGWDIADSIGHLCFFDEAATQALTDPQAFGAARAVVMESSSSPPAGSGADGRGDVSPRRPDETLARGLEPPQLLARWRRARHELLVAAGQADPAARVPWYGPSMGVASFLTARLMETWAHGQDVADALGWPPTATSRLRHVVHLGVAARPYAFAVHHVTDPGDPIRVEVAGPDGTTWTWGPSDATNLVRGSALDLALVVTQRRHRADTSLDVMGETATAWLKVAQAFAGPAGPGRHPGPAPADRKAQA
jgi:uncharacterized protein (TIGR03084 family)